MSDDKSEIDRLRGELAAANWCIGLLFNLMLSESASNEERQVVTTTMRTGLIQHPGESAAFNEGFTGFLESITPPLSKEL